jgi:hypothetical protein
MVWVFSANDKEAGIAVAQAAASAWALCKEWGIASPVRPYNRTGIGAIGIAPPVRRHANGTGIGAMCKEYGILRSTVEYRMRKGMSFAEALTTPSTPRDSNSKQAIYLRLWHARNVEVYRRFTAMGLIGVSEKGLMRVIRKMGALKRRRRVELS